LLLAAAHQGAQFNALASVGKLKKLSSYISKVSAGKRSRSADAVAFFQTMQAQGFDVKIERIEREPSDGRL
jgi:uncharacterized protein (UPF0335 family)